MAEASRGGGGQANGSNGDGGDTGPPPEEFTRGGVRKTKFEPKVPARRVKKLSAVKREPEEGDHVELPAELQRLLKQSQEDAGAQGRRFGPDRKGQTRVAFGYGSATAGRAAAFAGAGNHKSSGGGGGTGGGGRSGTNQKPFAQGDPFFDANLGKSKNVVEPLDDSKYYPVTLPLRRPMSGISELLDEEEFGEEAASRIHDEDAVAPAEELDLYERREGDRLLFFQIPTSLPLSSFSKGVVDVDRATSSNAGSKEGRRIGDGIIKLEKLPEGCMGKLLVYESGAIKLQLGDVILDALPGTECVFAQELAAVNPTSKQCCFLGDVGQRLVLTPDIDKLITSTFS